MKIRTSIDISREIEVDISTEEIAACIGGDTRDAEKMHAVTAALNNFGCFVKAVPESLIDQMTPKMRNVIGNFLIDQGGRFLTDPQKEMT